MHNSRSILRKAAGVAVLVRAVAGVARGADEKQQGVV
jgi:hypothetical protein